jgi:amino acid adenylation domain-containing protein
VVVGTPIAGRNHLATEGLIGLFVNTLVLRTSLSGDPSFRELLGRVREVTLGAYAHQDLPFEKLVEELQPERDMSRSPLFQVVFALHNQTTETLQLPGLEANQVGSAADETAKFDITMGLTEIDGALGGSLQYSTDLFEASTISRMLEQFERLLTSAVSAPKQHISKLELLSSTERQQLLVERNETHVAYPHSRGIHELFEEQVALAPEAPALTFEGQHFSYAELNSRANQLAHYLRQLGVKADTPIGVCLHRSVEMVVALLAILKAGSTYVPLDPEYPAERLAFIVEDVFPPVILTDSSLVDDMPSSWAQTLCLDTESELWSALPTGDPAGVVSSNDNLAYVMYTSGSTGNPKGVAVPHCAVVRLVKQSAYVDFGPGEVFLQLAPVTFDASTLEIWGALLNGGRLVLMPPGTPDLAELGTVLRSEGVTVLWLTAGLFHLMEEQELEALASVRQVVAGGDVLSTEHVRRLLRAKEGRGVVVNGYGPTETTTFACCHRMSSETELEHGVPIGRPIGNTRVYVLSEEMELLGDGMLGELYIGGDGLARGYYNQPGLTADRFVPHPFSTTGGERLYRTGDYVSWRADGTLQFIGRRDTQVKIRGFRVEPGEVEAVLGRHGAVKECAVVVRETNGEKGLVAYIVDGNHEDGVNASELRDYLREQLPEFMLPAAIVAIESLPLTPNGKVDRRELAAREVRVGSDQSYVPPRTINEELLCNIWEEVLQAERVGIDDNFFDLGGDSILTIKVIVKARAVGLQLNVQQLFQYQNVHELAQELERSNESPIIVEETAPFSLIGEEDRLRLPAGVVDAYPMTVLQAGMLFHTELAPEAGQYHDIFSYHLRMPFDEEALQASLRQLLELHPILRTSFNLSDFSEPLQLVHEKVEVPLRIEDIRSLTPTEQEEYVAEWLAAEKRHHFDWRKAPLLRFQIARRDEELFQFSFSFHHAILDGWSLATMLTELFNVYAYVLKGDERRTKAPLSSSFRDFVAAEQAVLNSEEVRQYWTGMLIEAPYSRLPRLGQSAGPSRVAGHRVDISGELSLALKALARTAGVPLKSVLLAAHLRALSVLTGSTDVLTGMVSHGRPETADGEKVLGLFLNTLPFRRRLAGGTWLQLVQETFAAERELLPFRRYPMARMQQDLGNDMPLFEIIFNFVHFHAFEEMQPAGGLEVLDINGVAHTNFTLAVDFSLELTGSQIGLNLQYDTAELSAEQIEAVGRNYLTILESMTRHPLERYEQQSLLEPAERQRILYDWNDTREAYDLEKCLQQLFEAQ